MTEESKNIQKKPSLSQKQKIMLAISVLLFLILCLQISVIVLGQKNRSTEESKETQSVAEVPKEENQEQVEEPSTEPEPSTPEPSTPSTPKPSTPPQTPAPTGPTQEQKNNRQQVETQWTDPTSAIMYATNSFKINTTNYLTILIIRGSIKVGDTLMRAHYFSCDGMGQETVSGNISKMTKDGKTVSSATTGEEVAVALGASHGNLYNLGYLHAEHASFWESKQPVYLVYVLTKEEGNTEEQAIVNGGNYMLHFVPKNSPDDPYLQSNGSAVTPQTIKMGEVAEIGFNNFTMNDGKGFFEKGIRIQIKDENGNLVGIGVPVSGCQNYIPGGFIPI